MNNAKPASLVDLAFDTGRIAERDRIVRLIETNYPHNEDPFCVKCDLLDAIQGKSDGAVCREQEPAQPNIDDALAKAAALQEYCERLIETEKQKTKLLIEKQMKVWDGLGYTDAAAACLDILATLDGKKSEDS